MAAKTKGKVTRNKKTGTLSAPVSKTVIKRFHTLMKNATAFGKLIGAT